MLPHPLGATSDLGRNQSHVSGKSGFEPDLAVHGKASGSARFVSRRLRALEHSALSTRADPECMVLDWERSAWRGIPGWDWIHYVFEYHAMVRRDSPQAIVTEIEKLWKTPAFLSYAQKTGIDTVLKEITFLYLLYFLRVHSPRDHASRLRGILKKFRSRYFNNIVLKVPKLKVSVITPSYKQLPWLKLCIASIADQEDVAVEHIIQDAQTGSDLEDWVRTHSNAQLHVECDTGMYDAINRGIARSSETLFAG